MPRSTPEFIKMKCLAPRRSVNTLLMILICGCDSWMLVISVLTLGTQGWVFGVTGRGWIPCRHTFCLHLVLFLSWVLKALLFVSDDIGCGPVLNFAGSFLGWIVFWFLWVECSWYLMTQQLQLLSSFLRCESLIKLFEAYFFQDEWWGLFFFNGFKDEKVETVYIYWIRGLSHWCLADVLLIRKQLLCLLGNVLLGINLSFAGWFWAC